MNTDDIIKYLETPKDWKKLNNEERANTIVLSFIGYVARPKNIPKATFKKCVEVFNKNRGKVEREIEAVLEVLNEGS